MTNEESLSLKMKGVALVDLVPSAQHIVGPSGGEVSQLVVVAGTTIARSLFQSKEVVDVLSCGVFKSVLASKMDGPSVESVVERGGSSGSDKGGEVGMGVLGQVGGGQEPLALELEPVLL